MNSRTRRTTLAAALVSAALLTASGQPAYAGPYTIDQCRDAITNSAKRVLADWSVQGANTKYDSCASGGTFGYHLNNGYVPYGTDYWLHLTAPASLPEVSIERLQTHYRFPSHSGNQAYFEVRNGGSVRFGEQLPADHTASPIDVGMAVGARQISLRHFCSTANGAVNCNYSSGSEVLRITKARLTLREDAQPSATIDGGTLTAPGGRRGTETLTYSASDNASGVERVRIKLGATEVAQADFSAGCPRDDWAACQRTRNAQTVNVDTTQVADGSYPLTLEVTDAAANTRTVSGGSVVVDNIQPPSASEPPTVSGAARAGRTLTGTRGTWSGTGNSYAEQWERCTTAEATSCSAISGATGLTYTATQDDTGKRLRLTVTATNGEGSTQASSSMTDAVVHIPPPTNTQPPSVSGTTRVGRQLAGDRGQWESQTEVAYAYRWLRCPAAEVADCVEIADGNTLTYTATNDDVGKRLRLRVTATNDEGPTVAHSEPTAAVVYIPPPEDTQAPSVSGTARVGRALTGDRGQWNSQTDVTYAQQWERCTSEEAASCAAIAGADTLTYTSTHDDVGKRLRLRVTATNDEGSTTAISAATAAVVYIPPPSSTQPPTVSGTARAGRALTGTRGEWNSETEVAYAYAWQRCDAEGANCASIGGADTLTYTATQDDVGKRLRLRVTATNDEGQTTASSAATDAVVYIPPPSSTQPPTVSGTARVARTLTGDRGQWESQTEVAYAYRWLRCDGDDIGACAAIDGADQLIYTAQYADVGKRLRLGVTATNDEGPTTAHSTPTAAVVYIAPPQNSEPPTVSGTPRVGRQLTGERGSWTSQTDVDYTQQWERCDDAETASCAAIAGADALTYTVAQADVGKRVRLRVTAQNDEGPTVAHSALTDAAFYIPPPENTGRPQLGGDPRARRVVTATRGQWSSQTDVTYAYQWARCSSDVTDCQAIAGAADLSYAVTADDVGKRLRIRVEASNDEGTTAATSDASGVVADVPAPQNTSPPTISGEPRVGGRLTAQRGEWSADDEPTYAYRWERCTTTEASSCGAIPGAEQGTYDVVAADADKRLRVTVTATSVDGSTQASSALTQSVPQPVAPSNQQPPSETVPPPTSEAPAEGSGAGNGSGASRPAALSVASRSGERLVRATYGRPVELAGTLLNDTGNPIAGAAIDILEVSPTSSTSRLGAATTDDHGRYGYAVPAGPSRTIRFAYRAFERDAAYTDTEEVTIRISPTASLRATRRVVDSGERAIFIGRVRAPGAARGLPLRLERKVRRRWQVCARGRSRAGGRVSLGCRARGHGRQAYRLRVGPAAAAVLDAGYSNIVRVKVRR